MGLEGIGANLIPDAMAFAGNSASQINQNLKAQAPELHREGRGRPAGGSKKPAKNIKAAEASVAARKGAARS